MTNQSPIQSFGIFTDL